MTRTQERVHPHRVAQVGGGAVDGEGLAEGAWAGGTSTESCPEALLLWGSD